MTRTTKVLRISILFAAVAAGTGYDAAECNQYLMNRQSEAYVDRVVPMISESWSAQQFMERAAPDLRASVTADEIAGLFYVCSMLGPLKSYDGATGSAKTSLTGKVQTSAFYIAKAHFKYGTATFRVYVIKAGSGWMIDGLHINPELSNG